MQWFNRAASQGSIMAGTTMAVGKFTRAGILDWREAAAPFVASALGAAGGVAVAYHVPSQLFRPLLLVLLSAVLVFTLARPGLGKVHAPRHSPGRQRALATLLGALLGFYDGFFGPGTGAFLVFLSVTLLGFDFLRASALTYATLLSLVPLLALTFSVLKGLGLHRRLERRPPRAGATWSPRAAAAR